ncbi:MAG: enoyl-CoA hydratase-related protein [Bacteroidota bacterium]|uniref:Enoyl-CoA hydratase n=1 Tax=Christiangramia flava JLT2011 TaxID=1229726 RepID=A0A1L7I339_9FLAO|nr:enoyl-CoA hydratase-related protein [Christiangramia flava]APU68016.1 Enoyl-CoA hydratase [Christiangramia flava JLT2011]MAM19408.1 enoyl-CoA hydratase [Christiangramia sp.]MEE2772077.1 enoyl-CoA hydratase-related protein [Bacteroidota bacterium]OSS40517.1 Enoyl-CoA hydratase [Christiangramia flava JLT2011]
MSYYNISEELEDAILTIRIDRPKKLNALNRETIQELHEALKEAREDEEVKVIILTGAGEKAFVAGADISEFADFSPKEGKRLAAEGQEKLFNYVAEFPKPIIAAINGFALGGGLELAMAAHFRIASDNAKMGLPETSLGVIPGYGGTQRLPQLVGKGRAMEMIMTAGMIDANQALQYNLVNHVTEVEDLLDFTKEIARKILRNSTVAICNAISAINANYEAGKDGFGVEIDMFGKSFGTEDFKEGTTAFLNKRKAEFPGK